MRGDDLRHDWGRRGGGWLLSVAAYKRQFAVCYCECTLIA